MMQASADYLDQLREGSPAGNGFKDPREVQRSDITLSGTTNATLKWSSETTNGFFGTNLHDKELVETSWHSWRHRRNHDQACLLDDSVVLA
jgi:hypothetical protein